MKILGIAANFYNKDAPRQPLPKDLNIFVKVPSSLAKGNVFHYPRWSQNVWHEMELVLRIGKKLKNVSEKEAHNVFDGIALGMDWTAKDLQLKAKEKGWPWAFAKGFDEATFLSDFFPVNHFGNVNQIDLIFKINGQVVEQGNTRDLKANFGQIISYCSKFMTLNPGDLIMTGAPPSPGPIQIGDVCEGYIGDHKLLDFKVV
ncbi:fumarylacetoacetate hydrolase family protein [Flagellimonas meridianipacifica]|uniref:2-keto-4-pentenoate hydratase/2-oxohepta-3-ene-1,7-dioic acid hydratase in catechol pathway n=1 Tax=Flagellimonas meridianipacifica TaxID=1080225 RepID=A0A2T0M8P5_9FLAO|nr:fumarylacetoacetate hydrolase family protein [Allomuricauda pacifica]PRX53843.1 2-keto-4-pentenoate hydratase/2-oxohepta-3-ene-1,7-dioic acid hydratase in catechol pathway [Allomuricauda pacifica]